MKFTKKIVTMLMTVLCLFSFMILTSAEPNFIIVSPNGITSPEETGSGNTLCDVINALRAEANISALYYDEALCQQAAEQIEILASSPNVPTPSLQISRIVVQGHADINTMLSAIVLDARQKNFLLKSSYMRFGYACNEDETIWVLLFVMMHNDHL